MSKRASGIFFWVLAISVLAMVVLYITLLLPMGSIDWIRDTPPCPGTCEYECEYNEEAVETSSCDFNYPICCVDIAPDPNDNND